jgi:hypothetical protein
LAPYRKFRTISRERLLAIAFGLSASFLLPAFAFPQTAPSLPDGDRVQWTVTPQVLNYDVVILGAGTGGVSAAVQAARMGVRVAVIEETDWIGGQMTAAGVSSMDDTPVERSSGMYMEFVNRIIAYYSARRKSVGTCYWGTETVCFEPSVGQKILRAMIDEENARGSRLDLYVRHRPTAILKSGNAVVGVQTANGTVFSSRVVIDATEYGDGLLLAGIPYRIGNSTSDNPNPNACVQNITYTAVMKRYSAGVPAALRMHEPPPGYSEVRQTFARLVTPNGSHSYNHMPVNWAYHNAYRGMPDSSNPADYTALHPAEITKTGINWANGFAYTVSDLDPANRKRVNCAAKLKTLQFIYYVQHELGETSWSIADDEGFDTPYNIEENSCTEIPAEFKPIEKHFPVIPYVRESRRLIGSHTLTGAETQRVGRPPRAAFRFSSSLAVGGHATDLHGCSSNSELESSLGETVGDMSGPGPFQIPFGVFIPETTDGFLAAEKSISVSRLVVGAIRLQPITMLSGQAAGALAARAVLAGVPPRSVPFRDLKHALLDAGAVLHYFEDLPVSRAESKAIQLMALKGIMTGYDGSYRFGRANFLTRREAAIIMVKAFKLPLTPPSAPRFSDVPASDYAYRYIEALAAWGVTSGCGGSRYCPDDYVSRAQFAVFLTKSIHGSGYAFPSPRGVFADVPTTYWAARWIEQLLADGLTVGCAPNLFCPDNNVTRSQAAIFLSKALRL